MKRKLLELNLRLFEGEGTGGEAAAPQAAAGENRAVVYGIQPEETTQAAAEEPSTKTTSNTLQEREAEFEKLIKGDYKDVFTKRMQKVINERFGETKDLKAQTEAAKPILEMLQQRYGVDDISKLTKAIEEDNTYYEQEAAEKEIFRAAQRSQKAGAAECGIDTAAAGIEAAGRVRPVHAELSGTVRSVKSHHPGF